jgi:hypothetical protein
MDSPSLKRVLKKRAEATKRSSIPGTPGKIERKPVNVYRHGGIDPYTESETPTTLRKKQNNFMKQVWISPYAPLAFETMNYLTNFILCHVQFEEKRQKGSDESQSVIKVLPLVSFAMNCQNIYEVERAMRKNTMVIHIKSSCYALKYQASFLGRILRQFETVGLSTGTLTWLLIAIVSRINKNNNAPFALSTLVKSLFSKPFKTTLPVLAIAAGVFTTVSCAIAHYMISRSTTWDKSVDYKCIQHEENVFLIRSDLKFQKDSVSKKSVLVDNIFEFDSVANLPFSRRYLQYSLYTMSATLATALLNHALFSKRAPITTDVMVDL